MVGNGDLEAAAQAIPVTADTARRHYLDTKRAYNAADIQRRTAGVLLGEFGTGVSATDEGAKA